jgi:outer membrane protein
MPGSAARPRSLLALAVMVAAAAQPAVAQGTGAPDPATQNPTQKPAPNPQDPRPTPQDPPGTPSPPTSTPVPQPQDPSRPRDAQRPAAQDPRRPPTLEKAEAQGTATPVPVDADAERNGAPIRAMTLGDALRAGRAGNVALRAASLIPEQARMELLFAEAGFLPELYGGAGYTDSRAPARNSFSPSIESQTIDATIGWRQRVVTGGLFDFAYNPTRFDSSGSTAFPGQQFTSDWLASYRQPLLRGAWSDYALAPINTARYQVAEAQFGYERQIQDTLLRIVEAYWDLVFTRENWRVVLTALAVAEEQLRITDERIRVQALAPRDRVADESEVAFRREQLILAENQIRTREDDLRQLLFDGADRTLWQINVRPTSPIVVEPKVDALRFEPLVEVALLRRPEIQQLKSAVAVAEVASLQAERDTLPGLDLVGGYGTDGVRSEFDDAFADSIDNQYPDWSLRLEFVVPLGNQAARSRALKARLEVERQRRLLHAETLEITRQVREAVRTLQTLAQSMAAAAESVRLGTVNLETEQVKLQLGSSTAFEVQRRNQDLLEAKRRLLRSQLDFRIAESRLLYAQGLLTPDVE